jgi:hypothetical protein
MSPVTVLITAETRSPAAPVNQPPRVAPHRLQSTR